MSFSNLITLNTTNDISLEIFADSLSPEETAARIAQYMYKAASGDAFCAMDVQTSAATTLATASGTFTVASGAAGDTAVVKGVTLTAVDHRETSNITYAADSSGSLNSKFFTFQEQSGINKYYVWFNINSAGVDPAVAGAVGIEVAGATGASAATLATATVTAANAGAASSITFSADVSGSLNSKFFTFAKYKGTQGYYVWFNINGAGVDPAPAGLQGIQIAAATGASAASLATAAYAAILGVPNGVAPANPSSGVLTLAGADGTGAVVQDGAAAPTRFVISNAVHGVLVTAGASGHVIFTDIFPGVATKVTDGSAPTSFTFTRSITGSTLTTAQYQIGSTDTFTAVNLASAINANATIALYASATSALAVVTVKASAGGALGNLVTTTASGNVTAGAATLAGGVNKTANVMHLGA